MFIFRFFFFVSFKKETNPTYCRPLRLMTKVIIDDYSLEIVIVIINYNSYNFQRLMFIPLFNASAAIMYISSGVFIVLRSC